jgi:hypothetical protein
VNWFEATFRFARAYSPFLLAVVCIVVIVAGWWSLRKEAAHLSTRLFRTLAVLRILPLLLLIFLLLKPVLVYQTEASLKQHVAVIVDESESMRIADKVLSRAQLETAAYLMGYRKAPSAWPPQENSEVIPSPATERANERELGLSDGEVGKIKSVDRGTYVRRALAREDGALLERLRKNYILNVYGFSDMMEEIPFGSERKPADLIKDFASTGPSTRLGSALQRIAQDLRGQSVAGIVLISDGRNIGGIPPESAAEIAGDARIPIYAAPVGSGGSRDIAVNTLISESVVFKDDEFPVSAKITSRGYTGSPVPVAFEVDGAEVDRKPITLSGKEQLVTFRHKRNQEGPVTVRVRVRPQEAEETTDNNQAETTIRVIDKKIKVLMVDEIPHWDYRYLFNTLLRDPHVEMKVFLQQADRELVQSDRLYLNSLPQSEKDLFEFDLLIISGLRPKFFSENQMAMIEKFVSKMGGAVIFLGVENVSPQLYANTPLEPLLPVRLARDPRQWRDPDRLEPLTVERRLQLTKDGAAHSLAALEPESNQNRQVWEQFPPHYWVADVAGVKPAAQIIVESAGARSGAATPAIVVQPYGLGRVLYVGIDSTWRWRYKVGEKYFVRFWGQAVQFMTLSRLLGQNKRLQIVSDRDSYEAGETVSFSVRALDASFQPRKQDQIDLVITDAQGRRYAIRGYQEPEREGVYSAIFKIPYEGKFVVTAEDAGEKVELAFAAKRARLEFREPEADWATMARIARRSGGQVVPLDHLDRLPELLGRREARFVDRREQAMWDWWPFLAFFVFVKTVELGLRKYRHLK